MRTNALTIALPIVAISLAVSSSAQRGKPSDTAIIVVLPCAPSPSCPANGARLTGDHSNVYQTSATEGVNSILFGSDGNLSLQFQAVGKKNKTFPREIRFDSSGGAGAPVPNPDTVDPDYLFAAPDDGTGVNCDIAANNCGGVGSFGTVTESWSSVRLFYRFSAVVAGGTEKRYWTLGFSDVDQGRFASVECVVNGAGGRCDIWRLLPHPSNLATLTSRGVGTDVQETGDFIVPTEIIVCRASSVAASECASHLSS